MIKRSTQFPVLLGYRVHPIEPVARLGPTKRDVPQKVPALFTSYTITKKGDHSKR